MQLITNASIDSSTKAIIRCDLDVLQTSVNGDTHIKDLFRLQSCLPTLTYLMQHQAQITIMGHIGKPVANVTNPNLSTTHLKPFFDNFFGNYPYQLKQNLRFDPREEQNSPEFAQELAANHTIYINESFATCHRQHASICAITNYLPSYAGLNLAKEVETLTMLTQKAQSPFVVIIGGVKLESKLPVVQKFLQIADYVVLGGKLGLNWTMPVPKNLILPVDYVNNLDIGPKTLQLIEHHLKTAKTILWAGPVGNYEDPAYITGTKTLVTWLQNAKNNGVFVAAGGGDTSAAINTFGNVSNFSYVSTGGGAMLQFIAQQNLPGLQALGFKN